MKKIFVMLISVLAVSAGHAQNTAFDFAAFDFDAGSAAMAGAGKSLPSDIARTALYNPSVTVFSGQTVGARATYGRWMPDGASSSRASASAAYNSGRFGIGVAYSGIFHSPYEVIDDHGGLEGTFAPSDMKLSLGAGFRLPGDFSIGAVLEYLESSLTSEQNYNGFAASLYAAYSRGPLSLSLGVEDLGPSVKGISGTKYALPSSALLSGAYEFGFSENHSLSAALDCNAYFTGAFSAALGAEYSFRDLAFLRAGYRYATRTAPIPAFASCGAGLRLWGVGIEAAYIIPAADTPIGNSLVFSLNYAF